MKPRTCLVMPHITSTRVQADAGKHPVLVINMHKHAHTYTYATRAGRYGPKIIGYFFLISVDIDNYHDKCQIFIAFKFKARFLLQSESCRN